MRALQFLAVVAALAFLTGCRTGGSYSSPGSPRYAVDPPMDSIREVSDTLRIVSFNLEFAERVDSALAMFASERELHDADVVLLQEMDSSATQRIATALGMGYVYYPAIFHPTAQRDFGNAVLSRWPIVHDAKLILPHPSRYAGTNRTATAATVLGGDLNSASVGSVARGQGYSWPTEGSARTMLLGAVDHVFLRGLAGAGAGVVSNNRRSSDHRAIWVRALLR